MTAGKLNRGGLTWRQVRVGLVLALGGLILAYGIYQVGRLFDVFASRYPLVTLVKGSAGLIEGAPVTLAGQRIGQVETIRFIHVEERTDDHNLRIELSINEDVQSQIREDSRATLQTQGLLGDRYVNIIPGTRSARVLEAGDTIRSLPAVDFESVLATAATTMEDVQVVVRDLQSMTGRLVSGKGTLGALLADDRLYARMTTATEELAVLLDQVNRSDGTFGRLVRDPTLYNQLTGSLTRLDSLGAVILDGQGSLGRLIRDDSLYEGLVDIVGRADSAAMGVQSFVEGMNNGNGALARLIEDPALYDAFLKTVVDLQNLIEQIRADPAPFRPQVRVDVF